MIDITPIFDDRTQTVTYLVTDTSGTEAVLIDAVLDYDPHTARFSTDRIEALLSRLEADDIRLRWVLDTHAHADHLSAADYVRHRTGAKVGIGARITEVQKTFGPMFNAKDVNTTGTVFDALFEDGDDIQFGESTLRVMHTPGHTPACVTYLVEDAAFVGDTMFMPDTGSARADFPGGDARTLYRSIRRLLALPAETRIFVGHDYLPPDRSSPAWESTVGAQRTGNIHVRDEIGEDRFVAMRETRDASLAPPRLILPSLQVNIRAGAMPPPEEDGQIYLKLPVNRL